MPAVLLALGLSMSMTCTKAHANNTVDIDPQIESSVWEENDKEHASVTLNGKELVSFRGETTEGTAEDRAEALAEKLQELLKDEKIDPNKLVPAMEGNLAAIHVDGNTVLKFESESENQSATALEQSFKVVNSIRTALGAQALPASFLKMAENLGPDQAALACLSKLGAVSATPSNFSPNFSGHASWYGGRFHGRRTSNGEVFDQDGYTAAHRTLPFGTKLLVMNRRTGDSCVVQVNDRGPFVDDRIIDLSRGAAQKLNMLSSGVAMVDVMVLAGEK